MMAEESSDESAELVDKEEAVSAEKQFTSQQSGIGTSSTMSPPAPLPSFMTQTSAPSPVVPVTSQTASTGGPTPEESSIVSSPGSQVSQGTPSTSPGSHVTQGTPSTSPGSQVTQGTPSTSLGSHVTQGTPSTSPVSPPVSLQQVTPPGPQMSPYEASSAISVPEMEVDSTDTQSLHGGLFSWISGNKMLSKVVEKTKSSMETMITTLDPGMKEVIRSGGGVCVLVTSTKESKVSAIREAFQNVFGRASVLGRESQATTAAQPVGFTAGLKGAQERIQNLRQTENIPDDQPVVSIEGFIVEMLPDRWYELSCLILQDPEHRIDLQTFSQPSPIPAEYILKAQDRTAKDYPLRWSGLAVTIGQIVEEENPHIGHVDWQNGIVGVSRRESLYLAAKSLAYMYKQRLPTMFVS